MKILINLIVLFSLITFVASANESAFDQGKANAELTNSESTNADNSNLATELEQIKNKIQKLNRELFILEEDLLFPASTQVSVFVSVDIGQFFSIDSVELKINNKDVAGFLYTKRQRKALEQGGIQQLYQGNLKEGTHKLVAIFTGVNYDGRTVRKAVEHNFEKDDESLMIEVKVVDKTENYRAEISIEEWVL